MSKPDPAGGSLENILASIRQSLSEQSTDALGERAAAPVEQDKNAKPPRKQGLTQRLAGTTAEAPALGSPVTTFPICSMIPRPMRHPVPRRHPPPTRQVRPRRLLQPPVKRIRSGF